MNRCRDADNLYYVSIRMDGYAIIKKKYEGIYYTFAYAKIFPSEDPVMAEYEPTILTPRSTSISFASFFEKNLRISEQLRKTRGAVFSLQYLI